MAKFQQAGLGNVIASWLSAGPNQAISGEQPCRRCWAAAPLSQVAAQLGVFPGAAAGQLAQVLPGLVDQLSPRGEAPAGRVWHLERPPRNAGRILQNDSYWRFIDKRWRPFWFEILGNRDYPATSLPDSAAPATAAAGRTPAPPARGFR